MSRSSTRLFLGPLLFIIYLNDIADKLISLSRLSADDTSLSYSNQDTMQLKNLLIMIWMKWTYGEKSVFEKDI